MDDYDVVYVPVAKRRAIGLLCIGGRAGAANLDLDDPMEAETETIAKASGVRGCVYCGGLGHRIGDCPKLEHHKTVAISNSRKDYICSDGYRAEM
ncbi:unnamed protein product [Cochlearia groenlandica]